MNVLDELKQFASVHSQLQELPEGLWQQIMDRITSDDDGPGAWVYEWSTVASEFETEGELLTASHCYTMARFPFVDGPARAEALRRSIRTFDTWRLRGTSLESIDVRPDGTDGSLRCLAGGLSTRDKRPLLLFMGGIVSLKQQWASVLHLAEAVGMAVVLCEMPGVGENTVPYDRNSWQMLPPILDALTDGADVEHTIAMANSFGGHLALRCAAVDERIRGIVSNSPPISDFFTDIEWLRGIPRVTTDTLAHLTGTDPAGLLELLPDWALTGTELKRLEIPVAYLASLRDEIIPRTEVDHMRNNVRDLDTKVFDDVHASPSHLVEAREWMFASLLRIRNTLA
ncbi:alpha/beta fold hydrolase [Nocardia sp. SYP-A9097]|uniref:alpha/beta fold hydrolase n=1 Tax=Nocardia sp. SYP-A9097 TaxID=2663237 RepID=UPI00129B74D1|nr:alpha/beta fold hydrolase [Nocardia sp. SYP-A9097]MRH92336.1 alpha/beta fold hydrolase [Nocardia sp. SYP-A9097]